MLVVIKYLFEFLLEFVLLCSFSKKKTDYLFKAQRPDDYRTYYTNRPLLELTLDFAKSLTYAPDSSDAFKDAERFLFAIPKTKVNELILLENYPDYLIPKHV